MSNTASAAHLDVKLDAALKRVRTVLDNTRQPLYPADVPHAYDDKYELAQFLVRGGVAAVLECLTAIGLDAEGLATLRTWAQTRSVTVSLRAEETCTFSREESRKVEGKHAHVTEVTSSSGAKTTVTDSVVTTVTEYFWSFGFKYELVAYQGTSPTPAVSLLSREASVELKTLVKTAPRPQSVVRPPSNGDLTWLLQQLDAEGRVAFSIDRTAASCHTPRRNREVEAALVATADLNSWSRRVASYFVSELFPSQCLEGLDLGALRDDQVFVPVLPVFESNAQNDGLLPAEYLQAFLAEQKRSLQEKRDELARVFPAEAAISPIEARLIVTLLHAGRVCGAVWQGLDYVEGLLRQQLVSAIGKELTPADFSAYMDFHYRKLVKPEFQPKPFSYAVRRSNHSPEGVLSLEVAAADGGLSESILTSVASSVATRPMHFTIDASTRVKFLGERHLHAWVAHRFSGAAELSLQLVARARQFSSFILLAGRIASADSFEPKAAIIVQNKDLVKIPLLLEQIPTPKEFRDAIESLSPEQQRFAKALRAMQLESTLFGVAVIQIKPQLEKLLNLPSDSLTKEIKLTQELLNLFIEYQIPSDLLSYDGPDEATAAEKLGCVREYASRMDEMISLAKSREIEEADERRDYEGETNRPPPSYGAMRTRSMELGMAPPQGFAPPPPMAPMAMMAAPPMMMGMMAPGGAPAPGYPQPPPPPASGARQERSGSYAGAPSVAKAGRPSPAMVAEPQAPTPAPRPVANAGAPSTAGAAETGPIADYTAIPRELDRKLDLLDEDSTLRPTILNLGKTWTREARESLLSEPEEASLGGKQQETERNKAFDLLDALSKSGALMIDDASLHVVIAATHSFDKTLLETVIQQNVNPVEKVERSLMILASTIHRQPVAELLADEQKERFATYSPKLLPPASDEG